MHVFELSDRFTGYDFNKTKRRSYYPHNQQLISQATGTSSSRPETPADGLRGEHSIRIHNSLEYNNGDIDLREKINEKDYS